MKKFIPVGLISILLLPMNKGLLVNSEESNREDVRGSSKPFMDLDKDILGSRKDDRLVAYWHMDEYTSAMLGDRSAGNHTVL